MKCVQVIGTIAPSYGGPATASIELHRAFLAAGVDSVLLTSRQGYLGNDLSPADVARIGGGTPAIQAFRPAWPRRIYSSFELHRALQKEAGDADLIHMHGQYWMPHISGYLAARRHNVPYGVQVHGALEPYHRSNSRIKKWIYNLLIGQRILRNANYVLFASDSEAANAIEYASVEQVVTVPYGASLQPGEVIPDVRDWLGETPREQTVLFLGRLAQKKNPDLLVQSWAEVLTRHPSARLIVAGTDDTHSRHSLRTICDDLGISGSVYFPGPVEGGQKTWLYARSGLFVLPSDNESFGMTVAEAMSAGCSVLATRQVAASTHVEASNAGIVIDDLRELAGELASLLADPARLRSRGLSGKRYAEEYLTWKPMAIALKERLSAGRR